MEHTCYLLDPLDESVKLIKGEGLQFWYNHMRCDFVQMVPFQFFLGGQPHTVYCDEEGLLNGKTTREGGVELKGWDGQLWGAVLIAGPLDPAGDHGDVLGTVEEVRAQIVRWWVPALKLIRR